MGYKYKVDYNYFSRIDEEYKAYILGFIYADGSIGQPPGNRQLKLTISIQEEDGYILHKLAKEAGGRSVSIIHPPSSAIRGWKSKALLDIPSDILCRTLINYGCNINKSKVGITFPKLNKEMIPHFIRGFMDGNGSIIVKPLNYKYKRKTTHVISTPHIQQYKLRVAFCSTDKAFLEKLVEYLPIKKSYIAQKKRIQTVYILWIENTEDVQNCLTYLYKDAHYFLERKYKKFKEFNKTIKSEATDISVERLETT
jgi:hypothetical protein